MKTLTFTKSFTTRVEPTDNVKACASMFGLGVDEEKEITLYEDLSVKLGKGRVIYITGDSGAGKSTLLNDIRERITHEDLEIAKDFCVIPPVEGDPDKPLVDQFGDMPLNDIGALLAYVGIAEAFVYLRKPAELSDGQRYRFMLAQLIYGASLITLDHVQPVILVDEFLALLDRETARNVAYQVRRVANKFGLCFVVATTHVDIADDLQANTTYTMRLNLDPEIKNRSLAGILILMMIGITTVYRGEGVGSREDVGYQYLYDTIQSLMADTNAHVRLALFPSSDETEDPLPEVQLFAPMFSTVTTVMPPVPRLRLFKNSMRMLRFMVDHSDGKPFLTLQDDTKFCVRALDRIIEVAETLPANAGMCSFYTPWSVSVKNLKKCQILPYKHDDVYGTVAMLWRPEMAEHLLNSQGVKAHTGWKGWDMVIKRWLIKWAPLQCYRHIPCLAQHVGAVSSAHHAWNGGKGRQTPNFRPKFNAMEAPRA